MEEDAFDPRQAVRGAAIGPRYDLAVTVSGGIARPGFQKYFGIRWDNYGTVAASNVTVRFTLPLVFSPPQAAVP